MQRRFIRTSIERRNLYKDVFDVGLRILHKHIEIAILGEYAGVDQFVLRFLPAAPPILRDQLFVRKRGLRIFVKHLHVTMRRRRIQIKVVFLHIFAVIALVPVEAEKSFFQNRIVPIPHREAEADQLVPVADSADSVFSPAVSTRTGVIVRQIFPGRAPRAVILADGSPLPLG